MHPSGRTPTPHQPGHRLHRQTRTGSMKTRCSRPEPARPVQSQCVNWAQAAHTAWAQQRDGHRGAPARSGQAGEYVREQIHYDTAIFRTRSACSLALPGACRPPLGAAPMVTAREPSAGFLRQSMCAQAAPARRWPMHAQNAPGSSPHARTWTWTRLRADASQEVLCVCRLAEARNVVHDIGFLVIVLAGLHAAAQLSGCVRAAAERRNAAPRHRHRVGGRSGQAECRWTWRIPSGPSTEHKTSLPVGHRSCSCLACASPHLMGHQLAQHRENVPLAVRNEKKGPRAGKTCRKAMLPEPQRQSPL